MPSNEALAEDISELKTKDAVRSEQFRNIDGKLDRLLHAIEGNGKPGLLTRVDRIEQREGLKSKVIWLLFAAVVGTAATVITTQVTTHAIEPKQAVASPHK